MPPSETENLLLDDALQHHRCGRFNDAEPLYREFLRLHPESHAAFHLLGVLAGQTGRADKGIDLIRQAIALDCTVPAYHNNLGNLLRERGRIEEAIDVYHDALRLNSAYAQAHANLGHALSVAARVQEAVVHYQRAAELKSDWVDVLENLADGLRDCGQLDQAEAIYRRVLELSPDAHHVHNNLGTVLRDLGKCDEAVVHYRRALHLNRDVPETWNNLGVALADEGRLGDAIAAFTQAIACRPGYADAHTNLGATLFADRKPAEAIAACRRAIELEPENAKAHSNLGLVLLGCGEYEQGWAEHEWRYRCNPKFVPRDFSQPRWDGRELDGRTILIHAEQSFGDMIQFCRFVPHVLRRAGRVVLEVQRELARLLRHSMPEVCVIAAGDALPGFDVHCPLLSLPQVLGITLSGIPCWPYLRPESVSPARSLTLPRSTGGGRFRPDLHVGLVWAGRPTHSNDRNRSLRLAQLVPLGQLSGVAFHSLQKGPAAAQLIDRPAAFNIVEHQLDGWDFLDTVKLIATLDLVISVDTAVAHVAGAIGKPVWVMLPYAADWRWMLDRDDSPWYPTVRLFRQKRWGDWDEVIERIERDLAEASSRKVTACSNTRADPSWSGGESDRSHRDLRLTND